MGAKIIYTSAKENISFMGVRYRGSSTGMVFDTSSDYWDVNSSTNLLEEFPENVEYASLDGNGIDLFGNVRLLGSGSTANIGAKSYYTSSTGQSYQNKVNSTSFYPCITAYFNAADRSTDITNASYVTNVYDFQKISIVFDKGHRPAANSVGVRVYYKSGNTLYSKNINWYDSAGNNSLSGDNIITVSFPTIKNVYKFDIMFFNSPVAEQFVKVKQIILGEAFEITQFHSYETEEQGTEYLNDIPINTLKAEFETPYDVIPSKNMIVFNYINDIPFGKFYIKTVERTGANTYSIEAYDCVDKLENIRYHGMICYDENSVDNGFYNVGKNTDLLITSFPKSTGLPLKSFYPSEYTLTFNSALVYNSVYSKCEKVSVNIGTFNYVYMPTARDTTPELQAAAFANKCLLAFQDGASKIYNYKITASGNVVHFKFTSYSGESLDLHPNIEITDASNKTSLSCNNQIPYLITKQNFMRTFVSAGYLEPQSWRTALSLYGENSAYMFNVDRYGVINMITTEQINFKYAEEPEFTFDSSNILGTADYTKQDAYSSCKITQYHVDYDASKDEVNATLYRGNMPNTTFGSSQEPIVILNDKQMADITVSVNGQTNSNGSGLFNFIISNEDGEVNRAYDIVGYFGDPAAIITYEPVCVEITGLEFNGDITKDVVVQLSEADEAQYCVENNTLLSFGYLSAGTTLIEYDHTTRFQNWVKNVCQCPGSVSATVIIDKDNIPVIGDTIQIETAFQGIKQGFLRDIRFYGYDDMVADIDIACFPEDEVYNSLNSDSSSSASVSSGTVETDELFAENVIEEPVEETVEEPAEEQEEPTDETITEESPAEEEVTP